MTKFLWKTLWNGIIVVPGLMLLSEASFIGSLVAAVLLSAIAYMIGDQIILRQTNNIVATASDAGIALLYFWAIASFTGWNLNRYDMGILVVLLGVFEFFFHGYLLRTDSGQERQTA